jgi:fluoride exporter
LVYIGVGLGGMLGSILRYYVSLSTENFMNVGFPLGTLFANLTGSLFLGWFTSKVLVSKKVNPVLAVAISTGITGSFTTFSTFSIETLAMIETGRLGAAILYILISAIGGLLLSAVGYFAGVDKEAGGEAV